MNLPHEPIQIGLVGLGKIATDQHIPAISANPNFRLVGACDPRSKSHAVPVYEDLARLVAAHPGIRAVSICTPPQARLSMAKEAIGLGLDVFLEKPPASTTGEAMAIRQLAETKGVSAFTAWHSRFSPAVAQAQAWMRDRSIKTITVEWKENVRKWHPGQPWIFQAGGMGVFDPGINGLSILTAIVPDTILVAHAVLRTPSNCQAPIQADIEMQTTSGTKIYAEFDFLQEVGETWSITAWAEDGGRLSLSKGGAELSIDGQPVSCGPEREYACLYRRFYEVIANDAIDVDLEPLRLVSDCLLVGQREVSAPYYE